MDTFLEISHPEVIQNLYYVFSTPRIQIPILIGSSSRTIILMNLVSLTSSKKKTGVRTEKGALLKQRANQNQCPQSRPPHQYAKLCRHYILIVMCVLASFSHLLVSATFSYIPQNDRATL